MASLTEVEYKAITSYWWISTPSATFAITARDGIVVETADYTKRWAMGKPVDTVMARYRKRPGVTVVELRPSDVLEAAAFSG